VYDSTVVKFVQSSAERGMTMIDPKILDNLANRLAATLPPGIKEIKQDAEKNFRAILQGAFAKLNLVTREEFDVQTAVLTRTHAKVHELEDQIRELESRLQGKEPGVASKRGETNQQSHGF
jgi:BMFP domain-containing protein YqiC